MHFLKSAINEAPQLWEKLKENIPRLAAVPEQEQLARLSQFVNGQASLDAKSLGSVALVPLTIISHAVEFVRQFRGAKEDATSSPAEGIPKFAAVQGFCVGFLTAAAVACSQDWDDFRRNCAAALRLAICIGAVIDADEVGGSQPSEALAVRWKTGVDRTHLETLLELYPNVSEPV